PPRFSIIFRVLQEESAAEDATHMDWSSGALALWGWEKRPRHFRAALPARSKWRSQL
ncbi:hypothetical protein P7K49_007192, partial [Saguinus oedipus]